jgi:hypothetical protein
LAKSPLERITAGKLVIADLSSGKMAEINKMVTSIRVNYTMQLASELQISVIDPDFTMLSKNYFEIGRVVQYTSQTLGSIDQFNNSPNVPRVLSNIDQFFEIARVSVSQGPGLSPQVQITCYSMAIQQMKRDKKPSQIKESGSAFVIKAAKKYGLRWAVQKTAKKQTINKASGKKQAESLWDVLTRLASDSKFVIYEVNGVLVFASQKYLLNKWGTTSEEVFEWDKKRKKAIPKIRRYVPIVYPSRQTIDENGKIIVPAFEVLSVPSLESSDNDPYDARGSLDLARNNATQLRPGMTIEIIGVPQFSGAYLIESVSFDDISPDPVKITFKKPEKDPEKDKIKTLRVGVKTKQTNEFIKNDPTRIGPYSLQSSKTRKLIPDAARLLNSQLGRKGTTQAPPKAIYPLPSPANQQSYPIVPKSGSADVIEYGNIDLWARPIYKDEAGVYPLDAFVTARQEVGVNSGNEFFIVLPRIFEDDGQPGRYETEQAAIDAYASSGEHLGKFKSLALATEYKQVLDNQQVYVLKDRFPPPFLEFPESTIYPLPSSSEEQNYPFMTEGLITSGNINLYSTPTKNIKLANKDYLYSLGDIHKPGVKFPVVETGFNNDEPFALVLPTLYSSANGIQDLTIEEAYRLYLNNGQFLAKCSSTVAAELYRRLLHHQQQILLGQRFPGVALYV